MPAFAQKTCQVWPRKSNYVVWVSGLVIGAQQAPNFFGHDLVAQIYAEITWVSVVDKFGQQCEYITFKTRTLVKGPHNLRSSGSRSSDNSLLSRSGALFELTEDTRKIGRNYMSFNGRSLLGTWQFWYSWLQKILPVPVRIRRGWSASDRNPAWSSSCFWPLCSLRGSLVSCSRDSIYSNLQFHDRHECLCGVKTRVWENGTFSLWHFRAPSVGNWTILPLFIQHCALVLVGTLLAMGQVPYTFRNPLLSRGYAYVKFFVFHAIDLRECDGGGTVPCVLLVACLQGHAVNEPNKTFQADLLRICFFNSAKIALSGSKKHPLCWKVLSKFNKLSQVVHSLQKCHSCTCFIKDPAFSDCLPKQTSGSNFQSHTKQQVHVLSNTECFWLSLLMFKVCFEVHFIFCCQKYRLAGI